VTLAGSRLGGQVKCTPLEPLVEQQLTGAIPHQQLHPILASVEEDEHMTTQWILQDDAARGRSKPVKATAKVHSLGRDVDPD